MLTSMRKTAEKEACISISRRRARTTVEDFVKTYFPYHGLTTEDFLSKYWDTLVYVEATIYQMDEENEEFTAQQAQGGDTPAPSDGGGEVILQVLQELSLLDDHIKAELTQGRMYWRMERQLCATMVAASYPGVTPAFQLEDVHTASAAKSFDYRVLNLLLYRMTAQPYNDAELAFLAVDEQLVDVGDDLYDYEDDVEKNSFNIFRAYVHLFGRDAQMQLIERISHLERRHEALLAALPADFQAKFRSRHKEAAAEPGSEKWVFPDPVLDEAAFRAQHAD